MRLIDVHTLKLHEFVGSHLLRVDYAVLSHTWGDDEVTFQDMQNLNKTVRAKKGFPKILQAAKLAKADGLPWVWVDTCCIDKTSSAELSEAINSMYMWYYRSSICYAYLVDVDSHPPVEDDASQFMRSRWFTRGWTLQELIAPRQVTFHAKDWKRIGEKLLVLPPASIVPSMLWGEKGKSALCRASCIPRAVLFEGRPIEQYCVAQRMSWASKRVCTRVEDTAYSLLGLFGINMPLLYGEENKAFIRLQEEIIKATDDHSIYAWTIPEDVPKGFPSKWHRRGRTSLFFSRALLVCKTTGLHS
ncbi:HET-domain-containing protein [Echria macrotheca]|uniref:HET-domain-containing protein n=1 Tax=Echria macrotheca TaxID=438768 RepID=A0AAJ0BCC0_9PEZI|nr:HET-domain-containing protein [Echria macrotheca]